MHTVKFEALKRKAITEWTCVCARNQFGDYKGMYLALTVSVIGAKRIKPDALLDEWFNAGVAIIEQWDVRMVKKLVEIFPAIIPKKYHKGKCTADYNDDGDWIVEFVSHDDVIELY